MLQFITWTQTLQLSIYLSVFYQSIFMQYHMNHFHDRHDSSSAALSLTRRMYFEPFPVPLPTFRHGESHLHYGSNLWFQLHHGGCCKSVSGNVSYTGLIYGNTLRIHVWYIYTHWVVSLCHVGRWNAPDGRVKMLKIFPLDVAWRSNQASDLTKWFWIGELNRRCFRVETLNTINPRICFLQIHI